MKLLSDEPAVQQARAHSGRIVRALNNLAALVQEAWDKRYDRVLKYKSWNAYCEGEFGSGETAVRARQIVTVMLRGENLTEQAIAEQLGVSQPTVNRDLSEQESYAPARGGRTGDQRRQRRREQYRQPPPVPEAAPAPAETFTARAQSRLPGFIPDRVITDWIYTAGPVTVIDEPAARPVQPAIAHEPAAVIGVQYESAATQDQPAIAGEPAATTGQPATAGQPAAIAEQPAAEPQPVTAAREPQPASARERFLQGNTDGARAEIRRRVLAGQPVRREQLHAEFGVSEMFARQATAVEEEAAGIPDTVAHCVRELTALRAKYARVLGANEWADQCLQLVIDSLRTD